MGWLIVILIFAVVMVWAVLSSRLNEIESRLAREAEKRSAAEEVIAQLNRRLTAVEREGVGARTLAPEPVKAAEKPAPLPAPATAKLRLCQFCGRSLSEGAAVCICGAAVSGVRAVATPPPLPVPRPAPAPVLAAVESRPVPKAPEATVEDRPRQKSRDREWEAIVGGNWLNKLGVLLLVIGIALLLGYEFTRVGPAGRIGFGLGVSLTMLVAGVLVERRPLYGLFGRGLIGGGWAALYFTTYAMHAVAAARIIENVYVGTALLLMVACGMILHSLRYRSQTVSGLAYFIGFATLGLSDSTRFSVLALIPLAGSLLVLAYRLNWFRMAVFGVFATYATCALRAEAGAPLATTQALLAAYWLLFEIFDILRLRGRGRGFSLESLIMPLNAVGFVALSAMRWHASSPAQLPFLFAGCGALYLASATVRGFWGRRVAGESTLERMAAGEWEGPITISAALAAASIFLRAPGVWIDAGLLIEGELLFLAGLRFGQTYLRQLASMVFTSLLIRLMGTDVPWGAASLRFARHTWMSWTPATLATAAVFYLNRTLRVAEGAVYSVAGAVLVSLALGCEVPRLYVCVAWLMFAALLFEMGFQRARSEFLWQSYVLGMLGTGAGLVNDLWIDSAWIPVAIAAAIHFAITMRIGFADGRRVPQTVAWVSSGCATMFLIALPWQLAPADYLGLAWLATGAALFELGIRESFPQFRLWSYFVSVAGLWRLVYGNVVLVHKGGPPAQAICLAAAALICGAMSARVFRAADDEGAWYRDLNCAAAAMFAMTLAWLELPSAVVALAWALLGVVILEIGFRFSLARFRVVGNVAAQAAFGRLFFANFTNLGETLHISHRLLVVAPVALSEYFTWWRYRGERVAAAEKSFSRVYLYAPAILILVLMRFELGRSVAVIGWALFGLALFRIGLASPIVDLRWQSYAIAVLSFWRCWNTNFYISGSLGGIRARVLTGAIVAGSLYAAQLLAPRVSPGTARGLLDRHARTFYSILASALLAVLLFYEVSGGMLTMAWAVEALALLGAGFPLRDRVQRLSGLFLFMVCVLKLFLYDLRELETINRILSFIVLGVILLSVSWIYTRFRDRIQRYL